jgi:hypothetical protein
VFVPVEIHRDLAQEPADVRRQLVRGVVLGPGREVERSAIAGPGAHGAPQVVDRLRGIGPRLHRVRHLAAGTQHGSQRPTDLRHEGSLGEEEVHLAGQALGFLVVVAEVLDLLGKHDLVGHVASLGGHLFGAEQAHVHVLASPVREQDLLVDPVLGVRQIHVPEVDGEVHGLGESSALVLFEGALDRLSDLFTIDQSRHHWQCERSRRTSCSAAAIRGVLFQRSPSGCPASPASRFPACPRERRVSVRALYANL